MDSATSNNPVLFQAKEKQIDQITRLMEYMVGRLTIPDSLKDYIGKPYRFMPTWYHCIDGGKGIALVQKIGVEKGESQLINFVESKIIGSSSKRKEFRIGYGIRTEDHGKSYEMIIACNQTDMVKYIQALRNKFDENQKDRIIEFVEAVHKVVKKRIRRNIRVCFKKPAFEITESEEDVLGGKRTMYGVVCTGHTSDDSDAGMLFVSYIEQLALRSAKKKVPDYVGYIHCSDGEYEAYKVETNREFRKSMGLRGFTDTTMSSSLDNIEEYWSYLHGTFFSKYEEELIVRSPDADYHYGATAKQLESRSQSKKDILAVSRLLEELVLAEIKSKGPPYPAWTKGSHNLGIHTSRFTVQRKKGVITTPNPKFVVVDTNAESGVIDVYPGGLERYVIENYFKDVNEDPHDARRDLRNAYGVEGSTWSSNSEDINKLYDYWSALLGGMFLPVLKRVLPDYYHLDMLYIERPQEDTLRHDDYKRIYYVTDASLKLREHIIQAELKLMHNNPEKVRFLREAYSLSTITCKGPCAYLPKPLWNYFNELADLTEGGVGIYKEELVVRAESAQSLRSTNRLQARHLWRAEDSFIQVKDVLRLFRKVENLVGKGPYSGCTAILTQSQAHPPDGSRYFYINVTSFYDDDTKAECDTGDDHNTKHVKLLYPTYIEMKALEAGGIIAPGDSKLPGNMISGIQGSNNLAVSRDPKFREEHGMKTQDDLNMPGWSNAVSNDTQKLYDYWLILYMMAKGEWNANVGTYEEELVVRAESNTSSPSDLHYFYTDDTISMPMGSSGLLEDFHTVIAVEDGSVIDAKIIASEHARSVGKKLTGGYFTGKSLPYNLDTNYTILTPDTGTYEEELVVRADDDVQSPSSSKRHKWRADNYGATDEQLSSKSQTKKDILLVARLLEEIVQGEIISKGAPYPSWCKGEHKLGIHISRFTIHQTKGVINAPTPKFVVVDNNAKSGMIDVYPGELERYVIEHYFKDAGGRPYFALHNLRDVYGMEQSTWSPNTDNLSLLYNYWSALLGAMFDPALKKILPEYYTPSMVNIHRATEKTQRNDDYERIYYIKGNTQQLRDHIILVELKLMNNSPEEVRFLRESYSLTNKQCTDPCAYLPKNLWNYFNELADMAEGETGTYEEELIVRAPPDIPNIDIDTRIKSLIGLVMNDLKKDPNADKPYYTDTDDCWGGSVSIIRDTTSNLMAGATQLYWIDMEGNCSWSFIDWMEDELGGNELDSLRNEYNVYHKEGYPTYGTKEQLFNYWWGLWEHYTDKGTYEEELIVRASDKMTKAGKKAWVTIRKKQDKETVEAVEMLRQEFMNNWLSFYDDFGIAVSSGKEDDPTPLWQVLPTEDGNVITDTSLNFTGYIEMRAHQRLTAHPKPNDTEYVFIVDKPDKMGIKINMSFRKLFSIYSSGITTSRKALHHYWTTLQKWVVMAKDTIRLARFVEQQSLGFSNEMDKIINKGRLLDITMESYIKDNKIVFYLMGDSPVNGTAYMAKLETIALNKRGIATTDKIGEDGDGNKVYTNKEFRKKHNMGIIDMSPAGSMEDLYAYWETLASGGVYHEELIVRSSNVQSPSLDRPDISVRAVDGEYEERTVEEIAEDLKIDIVESLEAIEELLPESKRLGPDEKIDVIKLDGLYQAVIRGGDDKLIDLMEYLGLYSLDPEGGWEDYRKSTLGFSDQPPRSDSISKYKNYWTMLSDAVEQERDTGETTDEYIPIVKPFTEEDLEHVMGLGGTYEEELVVRAEDPNEPTDGKYEEELIVRAPAKQMVDAFRRRGLAKHLAEKLVNDGYTIAGMSKVGYFQLKKDNYSDANIHDISKAFNLNLSPVSPPPDDEGALVGYVDRLRRVIKDRAVDKTNECWDSEITVENFSGMKKPLWWPYIRECKDSSEFLRWLGLQAYFGSVGIIDTGNEEHSAFDAFRETFHKRKDAWADPQNVTDFFKGLVEMAEGGHEEELVVRAESGQSKINRLQARHKWRAETTPPRGSFIPGQPITGNTSGATSSPFPHDDEETVQAVVKLIECLSPEIFDDLKYKDVNMDDIHVDISEAGPNDTYIIRGQNDTALTGVVAEHMAHERMGLPLDGSTMYFTLQDMTYNVGIRKDYGIGDSVRANTKKELRTYWQMLADSVCNGGKYEEELIVRSDDPFKANVRDDSVDPETLNVGDFIEKRDMLTGTKRYGVITKIEPVKGTIRHSSGFKIWAVWENDMKKALQQGLKSDSIALYDNTGDDYNQVHMRIRVLGRIGGNASYEEELIVRSPP